MTSDTDKTLIHPTDWDGYLRYATHPRGPDWRPPFLSIPVGFIERLPDSLTSKQALKYVLFLAAYTSAPLIDARGDARGPRTIDGRPRSVARRIGQRVTDADLKAWSDAGLVWFSTVDGRSLNGRSTAQTGVGLGEDLDSDVDLAYGPTFAHLNHEAHQHQGEGR